MSIDRNNTPSYESILSQVQDNPLRLKELQPIISTCNFSDTQLHELYLTAVKLKAAAILYIPEPFRDDEIYLEAINKSYTVLRVIPAEKLNDQMIAAAIQQNFEEAMSLLPTNFDLNKLSFNTSLEMVKRDGSLLRTLVEYIRSTTYTADQWHVLYASAVKQNPQALNFVPPPFRGYKLCLKAVKNNTDMLECIKNPDQRPALTLST